MRFIHMGFICYVIFTTSYSLRAEKYIIQANSTHHSGKELSIRSIVTIGDGLAAGVRNDSISYQLQLEAFPSLIAKQLKVTYNVPDLSKTTTSTKTSTGTKGSNLHIKTSYHSWAFPGLTRSLQSKYVDNIIELSQNKNSVAEAIVQAPTTDNTNNLFIYSIGFDELKTSILENGGGISSLFAETKDLTADVQFIDYIVRNGSKGLLITIPDLLQFPYFQQVNSSLKSEQLQRLYVQYTNETKPHLLNPAKDYILPKSPLLKVLYNTSQTLYLQDHEVISADPYDNEFIRYSPRDYNNFKIKSLAKKHNLAVADFYTVYNQILSGQYVTHDGVRINPQFPGGNFFSSDGFYPTLLGQTVLANVCIQALNQHYGLTIPLLNTSTIK